MTKEDAVTMIGFQGVYEIDYQKDNIVRTWHISDMELIKGYGGKVIAAFCHESGRKLNFKISKIVSAKRYWIDIFEEEETAPQSGLYLFTCSGDNHLITELYHLNQGERFYKYFEGEYSHMNGWFEVIPLAYHCVSDYEADTLNSGGPAMSEELKYPHIPYTEANHRIHWELYHKAHSEVQGTIR